MIDELRLTLVHDTTDLPTAETLAAVLRAAGHPVRLADPSSVATGAEDGRWLILLVTRRSDHALWDHLDALTGQGRLLPVVLDEPAACGREWLSDLPYLDLRGLDVAKTAEILGRTVDRIRDHGRPMVVPSGDFVFLSYAFEDDDIADAVEHHLTSAGITVVRATDFLFGAHWVRLIDDAVRAARLVVSLLSPAYLRSFWCYEELGATTSYNRLLVAVEHDEKLAAVRPFWFPLDVDLIGLGEPAFGERLLAAVYADLELTTAQRVARAPLRRSSTLGQVYSRTPWNDALLDALFHPQLRTDPYGVGLSSSLRARRKAKRAIENGR